MDDSIFIQKCGIHGGFVPPSEYDVTSDTCDETRNSVIWSAPAEIHIINMITFPNSILPFLHVNFVTIENEFAIWILNTISNSFNLEELVWASGHE
jgi:hypothetical protein